MLSREEVVRFCEGLPDVYLDYPFDGEWQAMRHKQNKKTFAFIYKHYDAIWINLKVEPLKAQFLRQSHEA